MKVKVCGLREANNIREVASLGVDYVGLIFWPQSPRYVKMIPSGAGIIPDSASLSPATRHLSPLTVGVFVNPTAQDVITRVVSYGLDIVQLHGHETPTLIRNLRRTLPGVQFWKAISVEDRDSVATYRAYEDCVDAFVFDTKCKTVGGSGEHFDWSVLQTYDGERPFLLSGGIGPEDAGRLREAFSVGSGSAAFPSKCIGIDLNSRFETSPGLKDIPLLRDFLSRLRQ